MSDKCVFNFKTALNSAKTMVNQYIDDHESNIDLTSIDEIITNIFNNLKELNLKVDLNQDLDTFITKLRKFIFSKYKALNNLDISSEQLFSLSFITHKFDSIVNLRIVQEDDSLTNDAENLVTQVENTSRKGASEKFLFNAYKSAEIVRRSAEIEAKSYIFNACFLDRNQSGDSTFSKVRSSQDINANLRKYLQKLLNDIVNYLQTLPSFNEAYQELINNHNLFTISEGIVISTDIWSKMKPVIKRYLDGSKFSTEILTTLYYSTKSKDKKQLKAYNAAVILSNFDSFMDYVFGDTIDINNFGEKLGKDKFFFKGRTSNTNTSYRKEEQNIFVEDEADLITKLLIETTEQCDKNGNIIPGKYLTYLDFAYICGLLKIWENNPELKLLRFNTEGSNGRRGVWKNVSLDTKNFIHNKTLALIIGNLRLDFSIVSVMLAELHSAGIFENLQCYKELTLEQKLKFDTIMYQFFNKNNSYSIYNLTDFIDNLKVFRNLCQSFDSIFKNILTLCYKDEDGTIYTRLLSDLHEYNITVDLKNSINSTNAVSLQPINFVESFKSKYGFIDSYLSEKKLGFSIPVANGITLGIKISNDEKTLDIKLFDKNKKFPVINLTELLNSDYKAYSNAIFRTIRRYVSPILGIDFESKSGIIDNLVLVKGTITAYSDLIYYAAKVLNRIYLSNTILKDISPNSVLSILTDIYSEEDIKNIGYDRIHSLINLYGGKLSWDDAFVLSLAKAIYLDSNLSTSASVNNSLRKALSNLSFSKLISSYGIQRDNYEISSISASRDLDILNDPNLLKEVSIINEFWSKSDLESKKPTELTPAEISAMNILVDYIPALFEVDKNRRNKLGLASFIASVNSDKNTVDKLEINLTSKIPGTNYNYINAPEEVLKSVLCRNLGSYYSHLIDQVISDFNTLLNYALNEYLPSRGFKVPTEFRTHGFDCLHDFNGLNLLIVDINTINKDTPNYIPFNNAKDFISTLVLNYNKDYPDSIIELFLNIHVNYDDGNLKPFSNTILGQLYRYGYLGTDKNIKNFFDVESANTDKWSNLDLFLLLRRIELISSLLENDTILDTTTLSPVVRQGLEKKYKNWIDKSGNLILAKIKVNNVYLDISTKSLYLSKIGLSDIRNSMLSRFKALLKHGDLIVFNPILTTHALLLQLFTLLWMFTTVGSFVSHPIKVDMKNLPAKAQELYNSNKWIAELFEESSLFNALCKRNVSFTALMNQFHLNDLFGINKTYKIAVVEDLHKKVDVLTSSQNKTTPLDGATICDPFTVHLENTSLGGNGNENGGLTKKTFVHGKLVKVGSGIIIKTAVFGLTNDNMRSSPETALNLFYKMSNSLWKGPNGEILNDYNILESDLNPGTNLVPDNLYYTKDGKFYQILDIKYKENNLYERTEIEVELNGKIKKGAKLKSILVANVNNNFRAWELFGGLNSMQYDENSMQLEFSEASVKAVKDCMNHKGFKLIEGDKIVSQSLFFLPMKRSQIQYLVTEGAIKHGLANVNKNIVFDDNDTELMYQEIEMFLAGILLDKEHLADFAEISLPTLVVSACAALGYSFMDADTLYNGIASIADIALKELTIAALAYFKKDDLKTFSNLVYKIIIDNLANNSTLNFGTYLSSSILEAAKLAKDKNFNWAEQGLPISDNTVFNRAINAVCNYMTKNAIKLKMNGSLAIMTPSHKMILFHGDRKFSDYLNSHKDLLKTQTTRYDAHPVYTLEEGNVADVNIGFNYKVTRHNFLGIQATVLLDNTVSINYNNKDYIVLLSKFEEFINTYDELLHFNDPDLNVKLLLFAMFLAIKLKTLTRRKKLRTETNEEYELRINSEAAKEFKVVKDSNFTLEVFHYTVTLGETNDSEINYHDLRKLVDSGNVVNITEDIITGRDLGSYNLRFFEQANEGIKPRKFSIWDLTSVLDCHKFSKLLKAAKKKKDFENVIIYLKLYNDSVHKMRKDLQILSKASGNLVEKFDLYEQEAIKFKDLYETINALYKRIKDWWKLKFNEEFDSRNSNNITVAGLLKLINSHKKDLSLIEVNINGVNEIVSVNRNTLEHLDYEIIMPKVFKTIFGLSDNICLATILNNPNYFVILNITKCKSNITNLTKFNIEIKNNSGKHIYLGLEGLVDLKGMKDITEYVRLEVDENGVLWRLDEKGEQMYKLLPGTKIYSYNNTEVIILDNAPSETGEIIPNTTSLLYYLKHFDGVSLNISENCLNLNLSILDKLFETILNSKWNKRYIENCLNNPKNIKEYIELSKLIPELTQNMVQNVAILIKKSPETLTKDEKKLINTVLKHPYFIDGREKYNSFIESLKVIAARIPALSMQSFMAMKVVGFSNGDRNTAYVSDLLIFLQGSDFDIDAVTLVSYDVNKEGKIELWSPYQILANENAFEVSKKLPLPNNNRILNKDSEGNITLINNNNLRIDNEANADIIVQFFEKYKNLFIFNVTNGLLTSIKFKIPKLGRNCVEILNNINSLLREKILYYPIENNPNIIKKIKTIIEEITKTQLSDLSFELILEIYLNLFRAIDRHNTYLTSKEVNEKKLRRIINNSNLNAMYNIITDAANLYQSMVSIDTVTEPAKEISKTTSKSSDDLYSGIGNPNSFGEAIFNNYTGKDCIAKSASTLKTFFKLTHFYNKVLNSRDPELQKLLRVNPEILKVCLKYIPTIANVLAIDPDTILDLKVKERLLQCTTDLDFATELSALLGLSADNAKELILAKINAGVDMIGLYLYGISIGFTIPQLAKVMTGPACDIVANVLKSNIFTGTRNTKLMDVFDYFKWGPKKQLANYNKTIRVEEESNEEKYSEYARLSPIISIVDELSKKISKIAKINEGPILRGELHDYVAHINDFIKEYRKKNTSYRPSNEQLAYALVLCINSCSELTFIEALYSVKAQLGSKYSNKERSELFHKTIDFIEAFFYLKSQMKPHYDELQQLLILATGSSAMQRIGSIVGLNLGIPSSYADFIKKVNSFENFIKELEKDFYRLVYDDIIPDDDLEAAQKVNIVEFLFNPTKLLEAINTAEEHKINFNLYALVLVLPDLQNYVKCLGLIDLFFKGNSARYNYVRSKYDDIKAEYQLNDNNTIVLGMSKLISHAYIIDFLKTLSERGFRFTTTRSIQNGVFDTHDPQTLSLLSADELATFKLWMESEVIPYLKLNYSDNKFINGLLGSSRNNTISSNEVTAYTLPINMMPKAGSNEDLIFNEYLNSFEVVNITYNGHNVKDLLFLYSLIAFEWMPSKNSLMHLFKTLTSSEGIVKDYFTHIANLDLDIKNGIIDLNDLLQNTEEYLYFGAKNRNREKRAKYIYAYDPDLMVKTIWRKIEKEQDDNNNIDGVFNDDYDILNADWDDSPDWDDNDYGSEFAEGYDELGEYNDDRKFNIEGYIENVLPNPNYYIFGNISPLPLTPLLRLNRSKVYSTKYGTITPIYKNDGSITLLISDSKLPSLYVLRLAGIVEMKDGVEIINVLVLDAYNKDTIIKCN